MDNWSAQDGAWQTGLPTVGPSGPYNGTQCAGTVLGGNYSTLTYSRLVSPTFVLPSINYGEEIHLRYWEWFSLGGDYNHRDNAYVQMQEETAPGVWGAWVTIYSFTGSGSGVWTNDQVDLSAYAGKKIHIGFYLPHTYAPDGTVAPGWYVDDVSISIGQEVVVNPASPYSYGFEDGIGNWSAQGGAWEVGTPTYGPSSAHSGVDCAGTVLNGNYSTLTYSTLVSPTFVLPTINVGEEIHLRYWEWFSLGGDYNHRDNAYVQVQEEIAPGVWDAWVAIYSFTGSGSGVWTNDQVDLSAYAGKKIRIGFYLPHTYAPDGTVAPGWYVDDVSISIGQEVVVNSASPYSYGFEDGISNWSAQGGAWEVGIPTYGPSSAHSGIDCAGTVLGGNYSTLTYSRLVSPTFVLPAINVGEEIRFRYWEWFSFGGDYNHRDYGYVQIQEETAPNVWSAWANLSTANTGSSGGIWSYSLKDLSAYAGKKIRICFYLPHTYAPDGTVAPGWYIDDVSIQTP